MNDKSPCQMSKRYLQEILIDEEKLNLEISFLEDENEFSKRQLRQLLLEYGHHSGKYTKLKTRCVNELFMLQQQNVGNEMANVNCYSNLRATSHHNQIISKSKEKFVLDMKFQNANLLKELSKLHFKCILKDNHLLCIDNMLAYISSHHNFTEYF